LAAALSEFRECELVGEIAEFFLAARADDAVAFNKVRIEGYERARRASHSDSINISNGVSDASRGERGGQG